MKKMMIAAAFAGLSALTAAPVFAQETDAAVEVSAAEIVTAEVNGLVCDFCAQALNKVFKKTGAVETVDVNLDDGLVTLTMKAGETLPDDEIAKLIRKSGYSLVGMDRTGGA